MAGTQCFGCGQELGFFKREYDCKKCARIYCSSCCSKTAELSGKGPKKLRVCNKCYKNLSGEMDTQTLGIYGNVLNDLSRNTAHPKDPHLAATYNVFLETSPSSNTNSVWNTPSGQIDENDEDEMIRQRLARLKVPLLDTVMVGDPSTSTQVISDETLGERFHSLTGRFPLQRPNVDVLLLQGKKTETEQVSELMSELLEECKLEEKIQNPSTSTVITDKEIVARLRKLQGENVCDENMSLGKGTMSIEQERKVDTDYVKGIISESFLDDKLREDGYGEFLGKSKESPKNTKDEKGKKKATKPSDIFHDDYNEVDSDDELPWCCICNGNATLRCQGCDDDLYCQRCYREGHSREDYSDHSTICFKPTQRLK